MSAKKLGSNPPECIVCGDRHNLAPCLNCHQPLCPQHRYGYGTAGEYFCTSNCAVQSTIPNGLYLPHFGMANWKKHTLFYLAAAVVIFAFYYWRLK